MVAYSFKKGFAEPLRAGLEFNPLAVTAKRQTIRQDRKRHARPGVGVCTWVAPIHMVLLPAGVGGKVTIMRDDADYVGESQSDLDRFAQGDGFTGWDALRAFWDREYPHVVVFDGVLINWEPKGE